MCGVVKADPTQVTVKAVHLQQLLVKDTWVSVQERKDLWGTEVWPAIGKKLRRLALGGAWILTHRLQRNKPLRREIWAWPLRSMKYSNWNIPGISSSLTACLMHHPSFSSYSIFLQTLLLLTVLHTRSCIYPQFLLISVQEFWITKPFLWHPWHLWCITLLWMSFFVAAAQFLANVQYRGRGEDSRGRGNGGMFVFFNHTGPNSVGF